jgi:two-component system chemotaxis response regulator CheY
VKILVVDDSKVMRQIVIRTLRKAGFGEHDVVEAVDGVAACDAIRLEAPDLVLCDWNMPRMSGIDLLHALRAAGSAVPFAFVTSEISEEMRMLAEAGGALVLITKPFTPDMFRDRLAPILAPDACRTA